MEQNYIKLAIVLGLDQVGLRQRLIQPMTILAAVVAELAIANKDILKTVLARCGITEVEARSAVIFAGDLFEANEKFANS